MEIKDNKSSESLTIQHETVVDNSFNYIAISPDGQLVATFNSKSFEIKVYKISNLTNEIRKLNLQSPSVKASYSLAISNLIRIGGEDEDDALIAVSRFCNEDMMRKMEDVDNSTTNPIDREEKGKKGDDSKNDVLPKTFVISKRIQTTIDKCGGIVKFLDNRSRKEILGGSKEVHFKGMEVLEKEVFLRGSEKEFHSEGSEEINSKGSKKEDNEVEFTNLIVINASGITKAFIKHGPYVLKTAKEYKLPIIIQDKINNFYKDMPCTGLLQNNILSNYLFAEDYRNKKVEMYNLKSLDLEIIFQKRDKTPLSMSLIENPILSISNYGHLLAHCSSAKNITIYLMENGLEIVTKEFSNANRILLISFIEDDEKLFVVTEEENVLMINIWDLFTYKSDIRTRKVTDNTNILNSLQEDNCHSLAVSNGIIIAPSLHDGNIFSVLESSDVKDILNSSDQLANLLSIGIEQAQQLNGYYPEPWVNHEQNNYASSYLDENKTVQVIIGKTTVQVWSKKGHGSKTNQMLEYIWTNLSNERIEVTSLKVGNLEFSLDLSSSKISFDQSQKKIRWPNETHILKDACNAIKYLYERKYEVRQKNQNKYEKLVTDTEKIIKKCINKNPAELWRLSEIRYEIMTNLIQAKRILLLHQILFNFKEINKIDINGETNIIKVSRYLHIPRQYTWPVKEKKSDLEIAIEESSDDHEEKAIVAMLLDYYSNNAEENIGWMFTVTKAIPLLLNKCYLKGYLEELFYKPCFGAKEEYLNSRLVSKFVSQNELKKGYNSSVYVLSIKLQLLEKQNSKHKKYIDDENTHHVTTALRVVPLPDFTVNPENAIKLHDSSILLKIFKFIFWPKNYLDLSNSSPFLKFLDNENNILYDNPAIVACIYFKWKVFRYHSLWHLIKFYCFSALFISLVIAHSITITTTPISLVSFCLGYHLLVTQIAQLKNEGKKYWNFYNTFGFASITVSMIVILIRFIIIYKELLILRNNSNLDANTNPETIEQYLKDNGVNLFQDSRIVVITLAFAISLLCFEILFLLRRFPLFAYYIYIVINILEAALPFVYFMALPTIAFGFAMYTLLVNPYMRDYKITENLTYLEDFDLSNPITDILYLFTGKWSPYLSDLSNFLPVYILSISASIMLFFIMQNLLIAVMTNSYDSAKSNAKLANLKYRGELIADYEKTENLLSYEKLKKLAFDFLDLIFNKGRNQSYDLNRGNQRYIYYIGHSDYQEEWLKKAKEYRESHRLLLVEDISNQLLNDSSDDESDDGGKSDNELTTKNVTNENDNSIEEHNNNNNNTDEKILKVQEEIKKLQNTVTERLNFLEENLKEILSFVKKNT